MSSKFSFSSVISYISHPIFIPFLGVWAITQFHWVTASKYGDPVLNRLLLILLLTTVFIPIFGLGSIFQKYRPADFTSLDQRERSFSAWIIAAVYLALLWLLHILFQDKLMRVFFIAMALTSLIAGFVNLREKVSFHAIGWSGFLVLMIVLNKQSFLDLFILILGLIVWIGLIGFARLKEEAHTSRQYYLGLLIGLITNSLIFSITYGV